MLFRYLFIIIILINIKKIKCIFEPVSFGISAAALGLFGYNYKTIKENTYCRYAECCTDNYIRTDFPNLKNSLESNLFGQHILTDLLIPALKGHFEKRARKPLVISFHGTPGTGKNFVTDFIIKSLYKEGHNSKYVHKYVRSDFTLESQVELYKEMLNSKISGAVRDCAVSLFIFDEVDKIPKGVFESITSFLDHHENIHGVDYSKSIFIFLSNTAGVEIAQKLGELMSDGIQREDTKLYHFENILETAAYNLNGGLQKASLIESSLIDHYVPFLPLEKNHVEKCIIIEYMRRNVNNPKKESIKYIMDNYVTYDNEMGLFSTSGCKQLSAKVTVDVMSNYY